MAHADSVHSAVRVLITGASTKPSTNPFRSAREIIAGRKRHPARSSHLHPYPVGADYLRMALCATTLDETAQVRNGRDIRKIEVSLLNVTSDSAAILKSAVEAAARRAA
jgi:hypothetical protein